MPEVASRHHLELVNAVVDEALDEAGAELADVDAVAATSRPGPDRRAAGRPLDREGAGGRRAGMPFVAVDHLHGHVAANFLEPDPLEPPFLCLIASGGHTLLAAVRGPRGYGCSAQTRRRRRRRGARQGAPG